MASISSTNILIRGLPKEYTKTDLVGMCSQFGKILSSKVMINLKTGESKCFGFVRFESEHSASLAISVLNGIYLSNNIRLFVTYAGSTKENVGISSNMILIRSLPLFYGKKEICKLFDKYGEIIDITLIKHKTRYSSGYATVTYKYVSEAEEAVRSMNNIRLFEDSWPLYIQFIQEDELGSIAKLQEKLSVCSSKKSQKKPKVEIKINTNIKKKENEVENNVSVIIGNKMLNSQQNFQKYVKYGIEITKPIKINKDKQKQKLITSSTQSNCTYDDSISTKYNNIDDFMFKLLVDEI